MRGTGNWARLPLALLIVVEMPAVAQMLPPPLRESTSKVRWSSYVQVRYSDIQSGEDLFALRRFKLMVGGDLTPSIQWYAQGLFKDGNDSPTDGKAYFQEAWLRFAIRRGLNLVVGQFKPPFGRERFTPDFQILTMDRSLVTDALTPDGPYIDSFYRDRGFQVDGEIRPGLRYAVGLFDGRGANHWFHGLGPMAVGQVVDELIKERRVLRRPLTVAVGAAAAFRRGTDLPFRPCCEVKEDISHFRGADRRWGTELSADWGDLSVRAEYMRARLRFADSRGSDFSSSGWYVQGAKYIAPKWQVVAKREAFDPNDRMVNRRDIRQSTLGVNYYIRSNWAKVMASYVVRQERAAPVDDNLLQMQFQLFVH